MYQTQHRWISCYGRECRWWYPEKELRSNFLFFPSLHSITMVLTWWLRLELSEMGSNYVLIRASKWMTSNLIPKLWWTPSLVLYPPLYMCFTWSENASAYCLLAWWFLTSIDKATQLQTDWLLMLALTGLIASLKLLLLSCKQAYYNDKEGLYSYSCSRNAFFHKSHVINRKRTTKGLSILGVILTRKWWVSEFITFQAVSSV